MAVGTVAPRTPPLANGHEITVIMLAALPFPEIDPVLFRIGPFAIDFFGDFTLGPLEIRWYALSYIAGIICAWIYIKRQVSNKSLWAGDPAATTVQIDDLLFWGALGVILGGRLGYVVAYNFEQYLANPLAILAVWSGGMSFHGGFLGVIFAVLVFCKLRGIAFFPVIDVVATGVPIGLFFGRLANFINQELYGRVSDLPWAVVFPHGGPEPRHPSQLYEAALEGVVLFIVLRMCTHRYFKLKKPGFISGVFAVGYGLSRTLVELFRMPDAHIGFFAGGLTMGMLLSAPMVLLGLFLMLRAREAPA